MYTSPHITRETETVNVTMTVRKIVTLPLTGHAGGRRRDHRRYGPHHLLARNHSGGGGRSLWVDRLDSIDVGEIDLTGARDGRSD